MVALMTSLMACSLAGPAEVSPITWYAPTPDAVKHIRSLLAKDPNLVKSRDDHGKTPLHWASFYGNREVATLLIDKGADVRARDNYGLTPLHDAAQGANFLCVDAIIDAGAEVNAKDNGGSTPLHVAVQTGSHRVILTLVGAKADIAAKDKNGYTPLDLAAMGCSRIVGLLAPGRADMPLHVAMYLQDPEGMQHLDDTRPSAYSKDMTALAAICLGDIKALRYLIDARPEVVNETRALGRTPLHWAAVYGKPWAVRLLIRSGAHLNAKGKDGLTPLHLAIQEGYPAVAQILVQSRAALDIFAAAALDRPDVVDRMLAADASLAKAADSRGMTALHWASRHGATKAIPKLLAKGADMNAQDRHGRHPVQLAVWGGHNAVVRLLASNKVPPVEFSQKNGGGLLHTAAKAGHPDTLKVLLSLGLRVDAKDRHGRTALHWASAYGRVKAAKFLMGNGASVHATDGEGNTPLHFAAQFLNLPVAKLLVSAGAKVDARNKAGDEPGTFTSGHPGKDDEMSDFLSGGPGRKLTTWPAD